ncbi:disulfide bond formation protein B [Sphingomonas bacterium]|uniref:disulfide bond formation protein B n=1 Tax=Sphingomonas bacterium TaxID=1895847 RepID=UPI0015767A9D|nr:disulfide bond formation protein B [Sphingomonas bacterium]
MAALDLHERVDVRRAPVDRDVGPRFRAARRIALLVPATLLAGAWGSQLIGGLVPCEMCHWQRWAHYAALVLAALAFALPRRALVALAGVAIAVSGVIGVIHAGAEWHWWTDVSACTSTVARGLSADEMLRRIMAAPVVRCDAAQWRLGGVSLAGWNALFSLGGAAAIGLLLTRRTAR